MVNSGRANEWNSEWVCGFDAMHAFNRIESTWRALRWNSAERLERHAQRIARWMREDGLADVAVLGVPADGRQSFGGWRMPLCWSPRQARLELVAPLLRDRVLADYRKNPLGLVMFSASTPSGGVEAGLVLCAPDKIEAKHVKGKVVLVDGPPDMSVVRRLRLAGAVGFVTDWVSEIKGIRSAGDVEQAVAYCNYLLPPWHVPARERGFGFAISPRTGQRLRRLLQSGPVRVRAFVEAELKAGTMPVITGFIPGRVKQEILVTAHVDEPGANDNASGVMMALELGRMLASLKRKGWQPEKGIRFMFSVETRGLMAMLNLNRRFFRNAVLGLNLDMLGCDQSASGVKLKLAVNPPPLPDPVLPFFLQRLTRVPEVRWKMGPDCGDNAMGDAKVGIPTLFLVQAPVPTYHTSLDRPDAISIPFLRQMGQVTGDYLGYLASTSGPEIVSLAHVTFNYARQRLKDLAATAEKFPGEEEAFMRHHVSQERQRLMGLLKLLPPGAAPFWDDGSGRLPLLGKHGLMEEEEVKHKLLHLASRLSLSLPPVKKPAVAISAVDTASLVRFERLIPQKMFNGFMAAESLPLEVRERLCRVAGDSFGWGAPWWLQWALGWSNGKRTLAEIGNKLRYDGRSVSPDRLLNTFRILDEHGFIRWRQYLVERDIQRALKRVGVRPGMLLMTHSSLSEFGYIEGGASTVVGALRGTLGEAGTLAMPTHTQSQIGMRPYDAEQSPSVVGAITEYFRKLPGVLRSPHPTHSVAACGPLAEVLLAGHTGALAPLAKEGFWGKFIDQDGWVLMMASLKKNTLMHSAELWSGLALPGLILAGRRDPRRGWPVVPSAPWHNNWFDMAYEELRRHDSIRTAPLGESTVYLMRGRDVVEAGLKVFKRNPLAVVKPGCACPFCQAVLALNRESGSRDARK